MGCRALQKALQSMLLGRTYGAKPSLPVWRVALGSLVIVCLVLTLANRFRYISIVRADDVRAFAPKVKIQHRDVVTHCWSAPISVFYLLQSSGLPRTGFLKTQTVVLVDLEGSRYNRPPPIS
jgi:hypothetical protein